LSDESEGGEEDEEEEEEDEEEEKKQKQPASKAKPSQKQQQQQQKKGKKRKLEETDPLAAFSVEGATITESEEGGRPVKRGRRQSYRDPRFFMSAEPQDADTEKGYKIREEFGIGSRLDDATLDLAGDDEEGMLQQKHLVKRWDRKKKKFVTVMGGAADINGMLKRKNESGALIDPKKVKPGEIYAKWQKQHRRAIASTVADDDEAVDPVTDALEKFGKASGPSASKAEKKARCAGVCLCASNLPLTLITTEYIITPKGLGKAV